MYLRTERMTFEGMVQAPAMENVKNATDWIGANVARFKDPTSPLPSRRRALHNEIINYEVALKNYGTVVPADAPGEAHMKKYIAELRLAEEELMEEISKRGGIDEKEEIYWDIHDAIICERRGRTPAPLDLESLYREFKGKYFGDSVPDLSEKLYLHFHPTSF